MSSLHHNNIKQKKTGGGAILQWGSGRLKKCCMFSLNYMKMISWTPIDYVLDKPHVI